MAPKQPERPPSTRSARPSSASAGGVAAALVLAAVVVAVVGVPAGAVLLRTARSVIGDPAGAWGLVGQAFSLEALVNTGVYAALIGAGATMAAFPAAWLIAGRERSAGWLAMALTPLLLPSYLAYAGWGLLRGPNTILGDWLARRPPGLTVWVGKATAVMGMVLWVWPLAAVVLSVSIRKVGPMVLDLARMEVPGRFRRGVFVLGVLRGGLLSAMAAVALLITGSAIPLHVAQVPTYAINLWKVMQLTTDPTGVWIAAIPLLGLAAAVAGVLARRLPGLLDRRPEAVGVGGGQSRGAVIGAVLVWAGAVGVPLVLFAWSLQSWKSVPMFWSISGRGVAQSLRIAGCVAGGTAGLVLVTWAALDLGGKWGRRAAMAGAGGLLFSGLVPGVLVGVAGGMGWGTRPLSRFVGGVMLVVLTHMARFGWVGVLGGWWMAAMEPREERWLRTLDGGGSVGAWLGAAVRGRIGAVVGIGLCAGALSFHEIESTVQVLPPGLKNLAQQLLDYLHYARDEQLSAAAVNLLGTGVVVAAGAAWLVARACNERGRNG